MPVGLRLTILWIWQLLDPLFYLISRLHYIYTEGKTKSIFRVRITRYKGKNVTLTDGTNINKNDLLIKIHLHNVRLLKEFVYVNNDLIRARLIYKRVLNSLPPLANYLKEHPEVDNIKGIIGITTVNKVADLLGFETQHPVSKFYCFLKKYGQLPIFLLSTPSLDKFKKQKLTYLFMSKEKLLTNYSSTASN
jgi:hypothetical protein